MKAAKRPGHYVVGGSTYWTHTNRLGAPFLQTTSTGAVYWQADYYPYGSIFQLRAGTGVHQPLRLPGQEAEQISAGSGPNGDTGRYYNGARWYRPAWGRFTQPDPIGLFGDPINLYAYALLNPETFIDPSGLCSDTGGGHLTGGPDPNNYNHDDPGCDPAGDANAPLLPPGRTSTAQYLFGASHPLDYVAFGYMELPHNGPFNYQYQGPPNISFVDAGNWGLGVYADAADIPQWEVNIAIQTVGAHDNLTNAEIRLDMFNAQLGRWWAEIYCHK